MTETMAQHLRLKGFIKSGDRYGVLYLGKQRRVLNIRRDLASDKKTDVFTMHLDGEQYATEVNASLLTELAGTLIQNNH